MRNEFFLLYHTESYIQNKQIKLTLINVHSTTNLWAQLAHHMATIYHKECS